ncbi:hypothetical protein K1719_032782 [Acacia pycnantha]|nr:hypothetical protein K1719_032782 [Acacia pycnantha]
MGISRDSMHKRRATGGKKKAWRKKRKYELGRQPANTKLSSNKTVRRIRVRGGNVKWRALRLDTGNYSWGSEAWYLQHYGVDIGRKKKAASKKDSTEEGEAPAEETKKKQFGGGRLLACISSRPGQCGRADGYILEGKELEFYMKKLQRKKGKGAGAA